MSPRHDSMPAGLIRARAEKMARITDVAEMPVDDVQHLVYELQVHQIELELQNEELRRAQLQLAETRDRYNDLYEFAPVGYLTLGRDASILEANLTVAKLLQRERGSLIGHKLSDFVARDSQDTWHLRWRQTLDSGAASVELQMSRPEEPAFEAQLDLVVAHPESATLERGVGEVRLTLSDITERKRRELLERRVRELEKLESLGAMAGGMAHDFNNLLTVILGHLELAKDLPADDEDLRSHLKHVHDTALVAADIANQLLVYSRKGTFTLATLDVSAFVEDSLAMLRPALRDGIDLEVDLASDLAPVEADEAQLRRVLLNLITNSAEAYGDEPGLVLVSTSLQHYDEARARETRPPCELAPGDYVVLAVSDRGAGIDPELLDRLFEPFFSTKFSGRGMGLAGALGIVRGHGGAIEVTSEAGAGSCFRVLLPPSSHLLAQPQTSAVSTDAEEGWSGRVLVVDDEPAVLEVSRLFLKSLGFEVTLAATGREAIELFRSAPGSYRMLLLDVVMPGMRGDQVLDQVRRAREDIPVLLCSGFRGEGRIASALELPGVSFLAKPYTRQDLVEEIRALLGRR